MQRIAAYRKIEMKGKESHNPKNGREIIAGAPILSQLGRSQSKTVPFSMGGSLFSESLTLPSLIRRLICRRTLLPSISNTV